jgi:hypothetical protein
MRCLSPIQLKWIMLAGMISPALEAQVVAYDGFGEYSADAQVESGADFTSGTGLDGGIGWGGAYNVFDNIKTKVKIENRTLSPGPIPVDYENGEILILGGDRALRFFDNADGSYAVQRPLATVFDAVAGETLWFSFLFRTASGGQSPISNRELFQVGFDDNSNPASGNPRVSIGANNISSTFPSGYHFFARSTTAPATSVFHSSLPIAAITTYLLVCRIQPNAGVYDKVSLYVNPSNLEDPGLPSAEVTLSSGLTTLSHAFIRTAFLDTGDAYVMDEWLIGRDYGSVVKSLRNALRIIPSDPPGGPFTLRWSASLTDVVLETSTTMTPESWIGVTGPFPINGNDYEFPIPVDPGIPQAFFRLRR